MTRTLRFRHSNSLSWFITVPLAVIAAFAITAAAQNNPPLLSPFPITLCFIVIASAAEAINLQVEIRRHGIRLSMSEVPLLLALFYLAPLSVLIVRLVAVLIFQLTRRAAPVKATFNLASTAAAASLAALIVSTASKLVATSPETWLVLGVATMVAATTTAISTICVISLVQGRMRPSEAVRSAMPVIVVASINTVAGLTVLLVMGTNGWAAILLAVLAGGAFVVYRAYAQFLRQHHNLEEIYDVTKAIAESRNDGSVADLFLWRVRGLLKAEYATLWLPAQGRYPETLLSARTDDRGLVDWSATPPEVRQRAVTTERTVAVGPKTGDEDLRAIMRAAGTKDAVVVPLRSGGAVIGTLEVTGRMNEQVLFTPDDVRLLETLAAHASVAVENSRLVERLRFDAYHDSVTGLPNRRRMTGALEEAVKISAPDEVVAVMFFDVAGLRDVNESLGHAAGDKLLREFGERLRGICPAALVGRVGGDTFAVTMRIQDAEKAIETASALRSALRTPMEIGSLSLDVDAAVGIAVHPDHGSEAAMLMQRADVATRAAKVQSQAIQLFDPSLESRSVRRLGLAADLRRALDHGDLRVEFQPKIALGTRAIVGVECLARWEHPVHGAVIPEDFVAVAEHTGQLGRLTDFVLREGLRRARAWADAGTPMPVAVNLSPRSLLDHDIVELVGGLLAEYGIEPRMLTLEITEDGLIGHTDRTMPTLLRLDALGVRLSVDDFGTRYSSLSYLRRLPIDEVKIDRSFVQGMVTDPGDLAIVRAIVDLSRHFGLTVVAEGVESELTLSLLSEIGCDVGQGFLFSRPLPVDRLEAWLGARGDAEGTLPPGEIRVLRAVQ